jgi:hypothetical protein
MTQITRFPNDNVGTVVFSNDNEYGGYIMAIINYYLADRIFGLEPIDWDKRYKDVVIKSHNDTLGKPARPDDPRPPSSPFKSYAGKYLNLGYGPIELCLVDQDEEDSCGTSALPGTLKDVPTLMAKWNKFWSTHFKLEHFDGDLWNMTVLDSRVRILPPFPTIASKEADVVSVDCFRA